MDIQGIERRGSRALSGYGTATPCAQMLEGSATLCASSVTSLTPRHAVALFDTCERYNPFFVYVYIYMFCFRGPLTIRM